MSEPLTAGDRQFVFWHARQFASPGPGEDRAEAYAEWYVGRYCGPSGTMEDLPSHPFAWPQFLKEQLVPDGYDEAADPRMSGRADPATVAVIEMADRTRACAPSGGEPLPSGLIPVERLALTVARGQLERGENPPRNITMLLVMTIDRLIAPPR